MDEKRRLPSWMVGASITNNVSKPLDSDANNVITKEDVIVVTESTRPRAKGLTRKRKKEDCLPSDGKGFLVKCDTKQKKGEFVEKDLNKCHEREQGVVAEKRKRGRVKRKVEEPPDPSRKKGKKNDLESSNENQASSHDEEDEDLTMEDLLSFAKEFVENDESDMVPQKASALCESKSNSSYTSSGMTGISLFVPQDTRSPMHEETSTSEVRLADSRTTGDPAQDMLDLFLGPLLKNPIPKEDAGSIKDIILPHEVRNQQHDADISNKPVTFTKKKSSLRDAVAMFLD